MSPRASAPATRLGLDGATVVLVEPSHDVPLVSIVVSLRNGAAAEPPEKAGLARIAMRMLRRGCEGLGSEQVDFMIDALGAEMSVDTSTSTVAIHCQVIARSVAAFVDLLGRMLESPTFADAELERLKRESIAEIVEARDNDRVVAQKAMQRTLFEGHPYGRSAGGTTQTVAAITRDDVVAFYHRHVVRANLVLGFAGDVTPEAARALALRLVSGLSAGEPTADATAEPTMGTGRRLVLVDKPERTQTQMLIGTLGTSPHDDDHVPLVVANAIFGGTFTSRLMKEIRSKRGWSYGASSRASIDRHRQAWVLWTFPAAQDAAPCLKLSIELIDRWVSSGVSAAEVKFIVRYLVRSHAFDVDTAAKRLHQSLDVELLGLPEDYFSSWVSRVRAVTPAAASAAVRNRIHAMDLLAVVVGTASQVLEPLRALSGLAEVTVQPFDAE
ncbi:MAG TPA: pitrilysin family protein [Polyangiaceae bacterium]|nr:pitrilysin family protein [Polyangiaceae bacterium]